MDTFGPGPVPLWKNRKRRPPYATGHRSWSPLPRSVWHMALTKCAIPLKAFAQPASWEIHGWLNDTEWILQLWIWPSLAAFQAFRNTNCIISIILYIHSQSEIRRYPCEIEFFAEIQYRLNAVSCYRCRSDVHWIPFASCSVDLLASNPAETPAHRWLKFGQLMTPARPSFFLMLYESVFCLLVFFKWNVWNLSSMMAPAHFAHHRALCSLDATLDTWTHWSWRSLAVCKRWSCNVMHVSKWSRLLRKIQKTFKQGFISLCNRWDLMRLCLFGLCDKPFCKRFVFLGEAF